MKIKFCLRYETYMGEELCVSVCQSDGSIRQYRMHSSNNEEWTAIIDTPATEGNMLRYYYSVYRQQTEIRTEWKYMRHTLQMTGQGTYVCYDRWNDMPDDAYLYTAAFTDCINRRERKPLLADNMQQPVVLKVYAPQLRNNESLFLTGEGENLGAWRSELAMPMCELAPNEWAVAIDAAKLSTRSLEFKFIVKRNDNDPSIIWEEGANRTIDIPETTENTIFVYELNRAFFLIDNRKFAGTAVPVFSLRSKGSFGVGDFGDLKLMIDWVKKTSQSILQILPINDTTLTRTWVDSYPYNSVSIFALHPMYCDLRQLPQIADEKKAAEFEALRQELNALPQIDYERVNKAKEEYMHLLFAQEGKATLASADYKTWLADEELWLVPYAQYCVLRDKHGTPDYTKWPDHNVWDENDRKALTNPRTKAYKEVAYYYYVQYVLALQMKGAHQYAQQSNVVLKGDIPIGVNRYGCDAWMEPRYFNLNGQAGAPPDSFSVNGQNWGFPTYNWEEMLADDCAWWIRRFSNMAKYFDAYRIDHVLGFFRIWEIPIHSVHGLLGQFQPALGMTVDEIEQYGLHWNEELMTRPFITDWVIDRWFGERAAYVRKTFLNNTANDCYELKPEFDTQRKVEAYFTAICNGDVAKISDEDAALRDTLYALISNVLFLRDHREPNKFHPRISSQFDPCFEMLWDNDKHAYNTLYNDYFYRRNNHFWYHEAMKKLPRLVNATRMLVCAEDLGMVPDCVPWVMDELKILSLEIQNMPKEVNLRFGNLHHNPYRSVCTISSHDTATMRMWWDEDYEQSQDYYRTVLFRGDDAPHPMPGWLARDIIFRHLASPSMLCILTLQDWLATDEELRLSEAGAERINIPANPRHYWRYRMHINLEDLIASDAFNYSLEGLIKETSR